MALNGNGAALSSGEKFLERDGVFLDTNMAALRGIKGFLDGAAAFLDSTDPFRKRNVAPAETGRPFRDEVLSAAGFALTFHILPAAAQSVY